MHQIRRERTRHEPFFSNYPEYHAHVLRACVRAHTYQNLFDFDRNFELNFHETLSRRAWCGRLFVLKQFPLDGTNGMRYSRFPWDLLQTDRQVLHQHRLYLHRHQRWLLHENLMCRIFQTSRKRIASIRRDHAFLRQHKTSARADKREAGFLVRD